MKFAVASEHRDFYNKHQAIEFEGLLNPEQLKLVIHGIEGALSKRTNVPVSKLYHLAAEKQFVSGHDLWREDNVLKKAVTQHYLAEVASELTEQKPVRLGYDQLFPSQTASLPGAKDNGIYIQLLQKPATLEHISCLQGLLCGLMLCLKDAEGEVPVDSSAQIFPRKAGNGTYFSPMAVIPFDELAKRQGQQFLLIVYTQKATVYVMREGDPHGHALKRLDYVFGDKLSDKLNPIVYR